ncbi:hypothetical protein [Cupriavidus sp. CuC1]|uniref:hypothetical protein n=1 Tax=Cupriavidus sp. CuC1 TaxID=3373131 RepID=UPI0037D81B96
MNNVSPLPNIAAIVPAQPATSAECPGATDAATPGYRIDGKTLVIDHQAEDIRHVLKGTCVIRGDVDVREGGLYLAGSVPEGRIDIPDGTLILAEGAEIGAVITVKRLFNLGTVRTTTVTATELLVNWGHIDAEEVGTASLRNGGTLVAQEVRYSDMESVGVLQGNLSRVS